MATTPRESGSAGRRALPKLCASTASPPGPAPSEHPTPNCGLLKFAGSANLTVEQVNRRRSEFLTTYGLNVVSIRPEAGAVTIGIARPTRQVIRTEEVWSRWQPTSEWGNHDLLIGVRKMTGEPCTWPQAPATLRTRSLPARREAVSPSSCRTSSLPSRRKHARAGTNRPHRPETGGRLLCLRGPPPLRRPAHCRTGGRILASNGAGGGDGRPLRPTAGGEGSEPRCL